VTLIPDQLRWAAEHYPDEVGFAVAGIGELTLTDWHCSSSQVARGLVDHGVQPGDRVALLLRPQDGLTFVTAYAAIHKAGGVAVPVNVRLAPAQIAAIIGHCEPRVVIVSAGLRDLLGNGLDAAAPILVTVDEAGGGLGWESLLAGDDSDLQVARDPDDLAEILYTSGTTSAPKGVAIRHSNSALFLTGRPEWSGRPWLHASPMFTFAGLTFVYQPMRLGMSTLYLPKFTATDWLDLLETAKPKSIFLVPSMVELLLADPATPSGAWAGVDMVSVGSAPIAPATLLRLAELVPDALVTNSYSMTEAGTAYFMMPKGALATHPGSVGQPVPPAEVRILDDDDRPVATGDIGNIQVKPAGKMREYYNAPEASAEIFHSDGWLRTGDLGRFDADGFLYVVGRAKDVIIRGGMNVYAADVEAVLYEHPAVREAAVVGVAHQVLGEDVVAFVVLNDGAEGGPDELIEHCRERVADYATPRRVHVVEELPRNATGKVVKRDLKEPAQA
jgi:acyl-CoA synthetase (AMP-forming)/AMP-acid ligase II